MNNILITHLTLRKVIGFLALTLPFILIITGMFGGNIVMEKSLSAYYWSTANMLFVSLLVTFGIFLLSYKGYDKVDLAITSIAGIVMILVALFPMVGSVEPDYLFMFIPVKATGIIHLVTAGFTFTMLGMMSFFQFTKSGGEMTAQKIKRNKIYRISAIVIWSSLVIMMIVSFVPGLQDILNKVKFIFWFESICLWAFGVSWLVKGEAILKDK